MSIYSPILTQTVATNYHPVLVIGPRQMAVLVFLASLSRKDITLGEIAMAQRIQMASALNTSLGLQRRGLVDIANYVHKDERKRNYVQPPLRTVIVTLKKEGKKIGDEVGVIQVPKHAGIVMARDI